MKSLIISTIYALSAVTTALASSPVWAQDGGSASGGGNSIDGRMIESYRLANPEKDPRFASILKLLQSLKAEQPYFAQTLLDDVYGLNWTIIPRNLTRLPQYRTGLFFETDQSAFQSRGEVFIDAEKLDQLIANHDEGQLFLHEILMAEVIKQGRSPDAAAHGRVRQMTEALSNGVHGPTLNSLIQNLGFNRSAAGDIVKYDIYMQDLRSHKPSSNVLIVVSQASEFVLFTCRKEALAELSRRQLQSGEDMPAGTTLIAANAIRTADCHLTTNVAYVITPKYLDQMHELLKSDQNRAGFAGGIGGYVTSAATPVAIAGLICRLAGADFKSGQMTVCLSTSALIGALVGVLGVEPGAKIARENVDGSLKKMIAFGESGNRVTFTKTNIDTFTNSLIEFLNQYRTRGLIAIAPAKQAM